MHNRMVKHRTMRSKKLSRLSRRKTLRQRRRVNGGGYSDGPAMINPGNLIHRQYSGIGQDCTGNPNSIRPGYISDYTGKGLPGLNGGGCGKRRNKKYKYRGGGGMPTPASNYPVTDPNLPPVSGSITPKPGDFPDTTGVGGTVSHPNVVMSMPGVPITSTSQTGGRYGVFPSMGPLNPVNGIGTSPAQFSRVPCETGTFNPLNPDPNGIQTMSTVAPQRSFIGGDSSNFPIIQVGQVDSMRYNAPTAGYRNDFMTFSSPSAIPGLTIQTPYDAKSFNQACIKTGGGNVALNSGKVTPLTLNEVWSRKDFDGTDKGLPVKFGGKRFTRRILKNRRRHL